jgi:hypothetical protein
MQDLRNKVDTASFGWTKFKAAAAQSYNSAYQYHKTALNAVEKSLKSDDETILKVFITMLGIVASPLIGRLVGGAGEVASISEALSKATFEKIKDEIGTEIKDALTDKLKDTLLEREAKSADEDSPW